MALSNKLLITTVKSTGGNRHFGKIVDPEVKINILFPWPHNPLVEDRVDDRIVRIHQQDAPRFGAPSTRQDNSAPPSVSPFASISESANR